jgi:hypothetical protein
VPVLKQRLNKHSDVLAAANEQLFNGSAGLTPSPKFQCSRDGNGFCLTDTWHFHQLDYRKLAQRAEIVSTETEQFLREVNGTTLLYAVPDKNGKQFGI